MLNPTNRCQLSLALLLLVALSYCSMASAEQTQAFKEASGQGASEELAGGFNRADGQVNSQVRANSPLLAVPLSLARFMFPKSLGRGRGGGDQAALLMSVSNKRSAQGSVASGGLDTLIGASGLGKRSVPSEYMNLEPLFGPRPYAVLRNVARGRAASSPSSPWDQTAAEILEAANEM